jgi:Alpha-L-arabinofuranosidase C-terminal domain
MGCAQHIIALLAIAGLLARAIPTPANGVAKELFVDPDQRSDFLVPSRGLAVGIEFLNHEIYGGLYAQMVFGESFEEGRMSADDASQHGQPDYTLPPSDAGFIGCTPRLPASMRTASSMPQVSKMWLPVAEAGVEAGFALRSDDAHHGDQYQVVFHPNASAHGLVGAVGIANYGLNCQHGLHFLAGHEYEGFTTLRISGSDVPVLVTIALHDWVSDSLLDVNTAEILPGATWTRVPLAFWPHESTTCGAMTADTPWGRRDDLTTCSGRLVITHATPGAELHIDLTYLAPGAWGLEPAPWAGTLGLPARRDVAEALKHQHIGVLRMGGTMCNVQGYRWKQFRGPRFDRQPYEGYWYREQGRTQSRGFAMFEVIDLCQSIRCAPIITFNHKETPEDMADLVEYCWGNASTTWGAQRIADGHPQPYRLSIVEIGNEVDDLADVCPAAILPIVEAMDERSRALGVPLFSYVIGYNIWPDDLRTGSARREALEACLQATRYLGERLFWDVHTAAFGQTAEQWGRVIDDFQAIVAEQRSDIRVMVLETNAWPASRQDHGLARGVGQGAYINMAHRRAGFVPVIGYANALQGWQAMDPEMQFPQGALFHLPNATFGQAAYHVIQMVAESWQPYVLRTNDGWLGGADCADAIAVGSPDGDTVIVRLANWGPPLEVSLIIQGWMGDGAATVRVATLRGTTGQPDEENSPGEPHSISIHESDVVTYEPGISIEVDHLTYTVITAERGFRMTETDAE